jgi:spermidine synthase
MPPSDMAPFWTTDLFVPRYRPMRHGDWELRIGELNVVQGYWSDSVLVPDMAVLLRDSETWMSMTPYEIESQEIGVRLSRGHVLIQGLGMGWSAVACALREEVTRVTVVERDRDIIALYDAIGVADQLPATARAKIRIVESDAFAYRADSPVDLLMPDIWRPLVSDGRVQEVQRLQANAGAGAVYFWGQEMEIARHARAAGRAIDDTGIAATIADFALPLIGPEFVDYASKVALVAERWMAGRWSI